MSARAVREVVAAAAAAAAAVLDAGTGVPVG